jgi:hypothetical protein
MKVSAPIIGGPLGILSIASAVPSPFIDLLPGDWNIDNPDMPGDQSFWITAWKDTNYNGQKKHYVSELIMQATLWRKANMNKLARQQHE